MGKDVFVSHSNENSDVAMEICAGLERRGVDVWIAPRDVPPGASWPDVIGEALEECEEVVFLSCRESYESEYVKRELRIADTEGMPVIPVKIDDAALPHSYRLLFDPNQRIEIEDPPEDSDHEEIAEAVDRHSSEISVSDPAAEQTGTRLSESVQLLHDDSEPVVQDVADTLSDHLGAVPVDLERRSEAFVRDLREDLDELAGQYIVTIAENEAESTRFAARTQTDAMVEATKHLVEEHGLLDAVDDIPWVPGKRKAILNDSREWDEGDCRYKPLNDGFYVDTKLDAGDKKTKLRRMANECDVYVEFDGEW